MLRRVRAPVGARTTEPTLSDSSHPRSPDPSAESPTSSARSGIGEYTLLCEACGYVVEGLGDGPCPECGTSIRSSRPEARPGSPFQVRPGPFGWMRTAWLLLRHPGRTFDDIRIEPASAVVLALVNHGLAAMLIVAPWVGVLTWDPSRGANNVAAYGVAFAIWVVGVVGVLGLLTVVEFLGVRFFAARRAWRVSRTTAMQICAHSSVGWIVAGLGGLLAMAAASRWGPDVGRLLARWSKSGIGPLTLYVSWASAALGYLAGLLVFEVLVYTGVRRRKYANRVRPMVSSGSGSASG